jgi:spore maturation protein CgeB
LITDAWEGIELFLEPQAEVLVAEDGDDVVHLLRQLPPDQAQRIGRAARARVMAEHTYRRRAEQVVKILDAETAEQKVSFA